MWRVNDSRTELPHIIPAGPGIESIFEFAVMPASHGLRDIDVFQCDVEQVAVGQLVAYQGALYMHI